MKIGDTVAHPNWGRATIVSVEKRGARFGATLKFAYSSNWFPLDEIPDGRSLIESQPGTPVTEKSAQRLAGYPALTEAAKSGRAGIQALKLGQILESHVEQLSVATENQAKAFEEAFKQAEKRNPKLIVIEGAWGVGKTHLLTLLSAQARRRGFAVSTTILDGWAATISEPMRLLESITSSIRFPGQAAPMGLGAMLAAVKQTGMPELRSWAGQRMIQIMSQTPKGALEDPEALALLEDYLGLVLPASQAKQRLARLGHNVALPPLKARSVDERGDRLCELLCDWAAFCLAGKAKGLLVILDEVDVDYADAPRWSATRRVRHDMTLRALGAIRKHEVPLVVAFGSAPAGPGSDEGIDAVRDVIKKLGRVDVHEQAKSLDDDHLRKLASHVFSLYDEAYPGIAQRMNPRQLRATTDMLLKQHRRSLSPVPRRFVRSLLHCLDLVDQGQASVEDLLK